LAGLSFPYLGKEAFLMPMLLLVSGIIIFSGIHLVSSFPDLRQRLVNKLGEGPYKGTFAGIALVGLVLIIIGKARADIVPLWEAPGWGRPAALVIMPVAFILLAGAYLPNNMKRFTSQPMLWGVVIWAVAHLLANGDLASLVLFGGLGAFAVAMMWSEYTHKAVPSTERQPLSKDLITVAAGLLTYCIFLVVHPYLFGAAVIT
jgi:uncharacterized membrane protein